MFSIIVSTPSGSFKADRLYLFFPIFSLALKEHDEKKKSMLIAVAMLFFLFIEDDSVWLRYNRERLIFLMV